MTTTTETAPIVPWASPEGSLNVHEGQEVLRDGAWVTVASIGPRQGYGGYSYVQVTCTDSCAITEFSASDLVAVRPRTTGEDQ